VSPVDPLARVLGAAVPPPRDRDDVRPSLQRLLDAITAAPAWVTKPRRDTVATNALGRALLAPMLDDPASGGNDARFIFLSPAARIFYPEWAQAEGAGHPPSTSHA